MSEPDGTSRTPGRSCGDFVLDLSRRTLRRGGDNVHLTSKPFDVLAFLVENRGRVVTKQELMEAVWKDTCVVEDNLTQAILKIRRVLGDEKDAPRYVQTMGRVGYRFVGPVSPLGRLAQAGDGAAAVDDSPKRPADVVDGGRRPAAGGGGGNVVGLPGGSTGGRHAGRRHCRPCREQVPLSTASATKPVFEADGVHFLYVGYRKEPPGVGDIYRASLATPDVLRVTTDLDPRGDHPVLTPDGLGVVFSRWRSGDDGTRWPDLWIVPITGGEARMLVEQASGAGFSPDGSRMAFTKHLPGVQGVVGCARTDLTQEARGEPARVHAAVVARRQVDGLHDERP